MDVGRATRPSSQHAKARPGREGPGRLNPVRGHLNLTEIDLLAHSAAVRLTPCRQVR